MVKVIVTQSFSHNNIDGRKGQTLELNATLAEDLRKAELVSIVKTKPAPARKTKPRQAQSIKTAPDTELQ